MNRDNNGNGSQPKQSRKLSQTKAVGIKSVEALASEDSSSSHSSSPSLQAITDESDTNKDIEVVHVADTSSKGGMTSDRSAPSMGTNLRTTTIDKRASFRAKSPRRTDIFKDNSTAKNPVAAVSSLPLGNIRNSAASPRNKADETSLDSSISDSGSHRQTLEQPMNSSARNRSNSLATCNKILSKCVTALEENPTSSSPPHTFRDPDSSRSVRSVPSGGGFVKTQAKLSLEGAHFSPRNFTTANSDDPAASATANRIMALSWMIDNLSQNKPWIDVVDQVLRNKDLAESRRPYARLIQLLCTPDGDEQLIYVALTLFNYLADWIIPSRQIQLWDLLESSNYQKSINRLLKSSQALYQQAAQTFQSLYLNHLYQEILTDWTSCPLLASFSFAKFSANLTPMDVYRVPTLWKSSNLLAMRCCSYFTSLYPSVMREILDENENCSNDLYQLPIIASQLVTIIWELATYGSASPTKSNNANNQQTSDQQHSEESDGESDGSQADILADAKDTQLKANMLKILFSQQHAFEELFASTLLLFDVVWKEIGGRMTSADVVIQRTKSVLKLVCTAHTKAQDVKKGLRWSEKLVSGAGGYSTQQHHNSDPLCPRPLSDASVDDINCLAVELVQWIAFNVQKENLILLVDTIAALRILGGLPEFKWELATVRLMTMLVANVAGHDGTWARQPHLASQVALFIDFQVSSDPNGAQKLFETLSILAQHGTGQDKHSVTKPLVRMLRSNRQIAVPLKIINRLLESKSLPLDRKEFVLDLDRSHGLSVMKTKVWSTYAEVKKELIKFQVLLITIDQQKFDPGIWSHEQMLRDIWISAFPTLKLKNIGPQQWTLMGFKRYGSIQDFKGVRLLCFQQMAHFARTNTDLFRHIVLYNQSDALPAGDTCILLTMSLLKFFTNDLVLMPMLFDISDEGFSEIFDVAFIWIVQQWIGDPALAANPETLISKLESHLANVMQVNKPANSEEFFSQIGISMDVIRKGWYSSKSNLAALNIPTYDGKPASVSASTLSGGRLSKPSGDVPISSIGNVSKLRKVLGSSTLRIQPTTQSAIQFDEPDFIDEYIESHQAEMDARETALVASVNARLKAERKGRQRSNSRSEREMASTSMSRASHPSLRLGFPLETVTPLTENEKLLKELAKQRKAELKEQKEIKALIAKQKAFKP